MFAELEKLRGQVEQLAPMASKDGAAPAVPAAGDDDDGGGHGSAAAACTLLAEQELDDEIAALNKQLEQAKAEMQVCVCACVQRGAHTCVHVWTHGCMRGVVGTQSMR